MDWSINLPSWAIREGYRLEGNRGTYDNLYLQRHGRTIKVFDYNKIPNIVEMEEIVRGLER